MEQEEQKKGGVQMFRPYNTLPLITKATFSYASIALTKKNLSHLFFKKGVLLSCL